MPRDVGTGIYRYPDGTPGISGQTIFSARYNTFLDDLANTMNQPLPVNMGGTGASTAAGARTNLQAEMAMQTVVNYDSHLWETGSFKSAAGATNSPQGAGAATRPFVGVVQVYDANNILVKATDATLTGITYSRAKVAGIWSGWGMDGGTGAFVQKAGDTMTGVLSVSPQIVSTGAITSQSVGLTTYGYAGNSNAGIVYFGNAGVGNMLYDGTTFAIKGGSLGIDNALAVTSAANNPQIHLKNSANAIKGFIQYYPTTDEVQISYYGQLALAFTTYGSVKLGVGFHERSGQTGATGTNLYNFFYNAGNTQLWVNSSNFGNIAISSDYRIKKDVADLPSTWDAVKALRPISYTHAEYTPPPQPEVKPDIPLAKDEKGVDIPFPEPLPAPTPTPLVEADNIQRWGFIAHELQETLLPTAATGVKNSPVHVQSINIAPVVAALTKALQEAMARIEALEAKVA